MMCLLLSRNFLKWHRRDPSSAQRLGHQSRGILFGILFFTALVADHWGENEDAFFATPDEAAKRVPSAESCNVCGIGFLPCNQHDVAETVVAKLGHRSEILKHRALPS